MKVKCSKCSAEIERPLKEINRSTKLGRGFFCSKTCINSYHQKERERVIKEIKLRTSTVDGVICGPDSQISAPPPIQVVLMGVTGFDGYDKINFRAGSRLP